MSEFLTIDKDNLLALGHNIDDYPGGVVLPIDKPYRWTSADVVRKVKFIAQKHFHKKNLKVGHAGTLDPLATGVLLVCLGKATKQAEALQAQQKEYIADITWFEFVQDRNGNGTIGYTCKKYNTPVCLIS